jgi:hypothetical protein
VIAWSATTAGVSGEMVRDLMVACVERRFESTRMRHPVEWLPENGSAYIAKQTAQIATALGLLLASTPVRFAGEQRRLGGVREDLEARLRPRHPAARRRDRAAASAGLDRGLQHRSPALMTAVPLTPRVPRLECLNPTSRLSGQTGCTPPLAQSPSAQHRPGQKCSMRSFPAESSARGVLR